MSTTIGGNKPPQSEIFINLSERHNDLLTRRDDLLAEELPAEIESDEMLGHVGDYVKQLDACLKGAETTRVSEKDVYLRGGREVDGFFGSILQPLVARKTNALARQGKYMRAKAEAERRRRLEEAERARREAEELAASAIKLNDDATMDHAVEAEREAAQHEASAQVKPADLVRTRSSLGSVSTLVRRWDFDTLVRADLDLEALRQHLSEDALAVAVRSFIRANAPKDPGPDTPAPQLRGVRIFHSETASVR